MDNEGARVIANAIYEKAQIEDSEKCSNLKRSIQMCNLRLSVQRKKIKHMKSILMETHEECPSCGYWIPREDFEELKRCNNCHNEEHCEHCILFQDDFTSCDECSEMYCADCIDDCDHCDRSICHNNLSRYCDTVYVACDDCLLQWKPPCPKHDEDSCKGWIDY